MKEYVTYTGQPRYRREKDPMSPADARAIWAFGVVSWILGAVIVATVILLIILGATAN